MRALSPDRRTREARGSVQFRVLGPLEVDTGSGPVPLGGPKQRAVLTHLLTRANELVPTDRLVDEIWGAEPPHNARNIIQTYVSRLRKVLGHDRIQGHAPGYRLRLHPSELDAARFEALTREARKALPVDPATSVATFDDALALWRGPALADLAGQSSLLPEAVRLDELRVEAQEGRVEALLASGAQAAAVGELETLLARSPWRERLWGLLILALYREGRQADALRAYQRAREILRDELGIDPSPELMKLHQRVLRQDPGLDLRGEPLRGYRLLEKIGDGPSGAVFRAIQPHVERDVAVKIFNEAIATDPAFVRRFDADAQAVAALEHPHIVPIHDYWREPGRAFIAARYLRGGSLQAFEERRESLERQRVLRMLEQVASGLAFAHRQGVAHGNVAASNILFDPEGNAYLGDFLTRGGRVPAPSEDVRMLVWLATRLLPHEPSLAELSERPEGGTGAPAAEAVAVAARAALEPSAIAAPRRVDERNPYKGLRAFTEADARDFFGRKELTRRLVARFGEAAPGSRFLAVVGASGCGKSSVVRAGLLPAIRRGALGPTETLFITDMFPGAHPIEELEAALLRIAVRPVPRLRERLVSGSRGLLEALDLVAPQEAQVVLVIDQLEEIFTLTAHEPDREQFLESLRVAAADPESRLRVLVTLRADFYDRPLLYPRFGELLAERTEAVPPLTPDEIEQAIRGPAEGVGMRPEPALVAEMIADVAHRPGSLPFLQYALTELFEGRDEHRLTLAAYRDIGGITGALSTRADRIYESADPQGRRATKQVFLRLVTLGEGREDTRRRVARSELDTLEVEQEAIDVVVDAFGRHRLLTFDREPSTREPTVEIAHEALLGAWSRLRRWIDEARDDLRQYRGLARAATEWRAAEGDPSFLIRGARLEQLERWAGSTDLALGRAERAYLKASLDQRDREREQEERRREREARIERRSARRLRGLVAVFAAAAVVAGTLTIVARNQSERARREATVADARRLAVQSLAEERLDRSLLLALAAVNVDDSLESRRALLTSLARSPAAIGVLRGAGRYLRNMVITPDGGTIAVGDSDGRITFFDTRTRQRIGEPVQVGGEVQQGALALSPDGATLAVGVGGEDGKRSSMDLIDVATRSVELHEVFPEGVFPETVAFSPTEELVAVATREYEKSADPFAKPQHKSVLLVNTRSGEPVGELMLRPSEYRRGGLNTLAFSPDGKRLIGSSEEATTILWDLRSMSRVRTFDPAGAPAVGPDGRHVAIGDESGSIHIVDLGTGEQREMRGSHASLVSALAFSPDGDLLASTSFDRTVMLWDLASREPLETFEGHAGPVRVVVFSPDGQTLYTVGDDGSIIVWDLGGARRLARRFDRGAGTPTWSQLFALSPEGNVIAIPEVDGTIRLWNLAELSVIEELPRSGDGPIWGLAFSPDGRTLATTGAQGTVALRDVETGSVIGELRLRPRPTGGGWSASFSPDGSMLAAAFGPDPTGLRTTVVVWELKSRRLLRELNLQGGAWDVEFSPDGRYLSAATCCYTTEKSEVVVWDADSWRRVLSPNIGELAGQPDFSPDGEVLAVGDFAGKIRFWNVGSSGQAGPAITGLDAQVTSVDISPDGETLVASISDGRVLLWDLSSRERIGPAPFAGEAGVARFGPDGRRIVAVQAVGSGYVWDLDPASWKRHACLVAGRNLTADEWREFLPSRPYERLCVS